MSPILLSIIVPTYNVEKYIEKCLNSIIPQLTPEVELIVVDDCTPDRSAEIAKAVLAEAQAQVRLIHRPKNGGLSAARNTGMEHACGKYCWFVDSDDAVADTSVAVILSHIKQTPIDMLVFNYCAFREDGTHNGGSTMTSSHITISDSQQQLEQMCGFLQNTCMGLQVWRRVYSMSCIRKNHLQFEPNREVFAEDVCFNLQYLNCCKTIQCIPDCLYFYLVRGTSIMGTNKLARVKELCALAAKVYRWENSPFIRERFHLVFAGIASLRFFEASWAEFKAAMAQTEYREFIHTMSNHIVRNIPLHFRSYGKRNSVYQFCYAKIMANLLSGRQTSSKIWFVLMKIMRKCNV